MKEKTNIIRNPLTVIAMFATLAEISGTAVLPQLANEVQFVYVWFLMLFPSGLVILFFVVLLFKHEVLYAPSDYKDESMFANTVRSASAKSLIKMRIDETKSNNQVGAVEMGLTNPPPQTEPNENFLDVTSDPSTLQPGKTSAADVDVLLEQRRAQANAEDRVIAYFEENMETSFRRNVVLDHKNSPVYDAISFANKKVTILDIKPSHLKKDEISEQVRKLSEKYNFAQRFYSKRNFEFEYILCLTNTPYDFVDLTNSFYLEALSRELLDDSISITIFDDGKSIF